MIYLWWSLGVLAAVSHLDLHLRLRRSYKLISKIRSVANSNAIHAKTLIGDMEEKLEKQQVRCWKLEEALTVVVKRVNLLLLRDKDRRE